MSKAVSETTSPSVGSYRDRDIPAWVDCPERGGRFLYVGIAFEDQEGSIVLSQLAEDEIVVSPGLIYRRS